MKKTTEIINNLMELRGMKRKRDVARYFGVSPQALSIWIAKDQIPPKHLLKLSRQKKMESTSSSIPYGKLNKTETTDELETVVNYLMKENLRLKEELRGLKSERKKPNLSNNQGVFDKIIADSLYLSGQVSDGIITEIDGSWEKIMGYKPVNLVGKPYDRDDLIHPDDLKAAKKIQKKLKNSESITFSKYSTIQRWKNGETGKYIMLSMVWDINVNEDRALIVCKPIDGFISD
jgi:PAS domain S-box-containing protein